MSRVDAVYRHGVFEPLQPVNLREEKRVQLSFDLSGGEAPPAWLSRVQAMQAAIVQRQGPLPDSALDIAADRVR
jgi:hypothetical protein